MENSGIKMSEGSKLSSVLNIEPIIQDVTICLKKGLNNTLHLFYDDYEYYKNVHDEILNLSIVKKINEEKNLLFMKLQEIASEKNNSELDFSFIEKDNIQKLKTEIEILKLELLSLKYSTGIMQIKQEKEIIDDSKSTCSQHIQLEIQEKNNSSNNDIISNLDEVSSIKNII